MDPRAVLALGILVVLLGGCLSDSDGTGAGPTDGPDGDRPDVQSPMDCDFANAIVDQHNHADASLHQAFCDMDLVGHTFMDTAAELGTLGGGFIDVSLAGDYAFVSNWGPGRSLSIVDVSDPSAPRHVSDFWAYPLLAGTQAGAASHWDVSSFLEGDLVVLPSQASAGTDALGEGGDPSGGGLFLVNVEDKESPYLESFTPIFDQDALVPVGVHNANALVINGTRYVAATTANGITILLEVEGESGHRTLREVSRVAGMHDTTVQEHPITGRTYIYGAEGGGVVITDITDPSKPEVVVEYDDDALVAYHQVVPSDVLIDGRHYTISATETQNAPIKFSILDTTDPTAPEYAGEWILPGHEHLTGEGGAYRFSPHNLDFDHGRIYIGHYHAGVWVIDVSSAERIATPVTLGFYQPHRQEPFVPRTPMGADVPDVWAATRHSDGHIYAVDVNTGLYVLDYTGAPSPLEGAEVYPTNLH
ncbi:MAG: LVIVD repeat-containing protein [Thermoplasmatota archaeon]